MGRLVVITTRVEEEVSAIVDRVAAAHDRSRAWVVSQAIEAYVQREAALLDSVDEGVVAADRGEVVSQAEMEDWFAARMARPLAAE